MAHSIPAQAEIAVKPDDFEVWLSQRHKWLQTAAHWLIQNKAPTSEAELAALTGLCLGEVGAAGEHTFTAVTPGSLVQAAARPPLRIKGLSEIRGVNRIRDQAALSFGSGNLAVIYGANGSGKTGFSRLMKQIFGSRAREDC